ncbi:hypothetical protein JMJ35_007568 [Cladonia borealis]|uniref:Tachykinin family protein n=1 Tax=Cladonia borealis TaxID=184061 RepID=A0AA39QXM5_9LECA|nr:hypothetical protein JMJ35_007568 [Cladonia borealis]
MHYPEQLLWVPMQKPADIKNVKTMQKIRSHAQREVRRRERELKPKRLAENSKMSTVLHFDVVNVETHNQTMSEGDSPKNKLPILPNIAKFSQDALTIAMEDLNPPAEAILLQPLRLYQMIYHCICIWHSEQAHRVCGGGPNGRWQLWMPSFLTNETILYAQSFSATIIYQIWTRHFDASKALVLKDQAVTRINRSLTESPDAVSDATVASVLCLAYSTHMEKSWDTSLRSLLVEGLGRANYLTHMNGLKRMIELNGGWCAVSSNELLGDMLAMCDYLGAIIHRSKLIYVPTGPPLAQKAPQISPILAQTSPLLDSNGSSQTPPIPQRPQRTSESIETMRRLTRAFCNHDENSSLDQPGLRDSLSSYTQDIYSPEQAILIGTVEEKMSEAIYITCRLYALALLHDVPFGHSNNRKSLLLLQQLLESTILVGWTDLPGVLLWVLLVGAAAERDHGEGNVIAGYLAAVCNYIGMRHWDAVREILVTFLAIEDKLDARAGRLARG